MKLDPDHDKQVQCAGVQHRMFLSHFIRLFGLSRAQPLRCSTAAAQVDAALSRAEAVRACTEIGKML